MKEEKVHLVWGQHMVRDLSTRETLVSVHTTSKGARRAARVALKSGKYFNTFTEARGLIRDEHT